MSGAVRSQQAPHGCDEDAVKLFIGNIPKGYTEDQLLPYFETVGKVVKLIVVKDRATQQSKGSAFVWFATKALAEEAIRYLHKRHVLPGSRVALVVREAAQPTLQGTPLEPIRADTGSALDVSAFQQQSPTFMAAASSSPRNSGAGYAKLDFSLLTEGQEYDLDHLTSQMLQCNMLSSMPESLGSPSMALSTHKGAMDGDSGSHSCHSPQSSVDTGSGVFSVNSLDRSSRGQGMACVPKSIGNASGLQSFARSFPSLGSISSLDAAAASEQMNGYEPRACQVIASNVPDDYTAEQLRPFFQLAGKVLDLTILKHEASQNCCAIVLYATRAQAEEAIRRFHKKHVLPGPDGLQVLPMEVHIAQALPLPAMHSVKAYAAPGSQQPQWSLSQAQPAAVQQGSQCDLNMLQHQLLNISASSPRASLSGTASQMQAAIDSICQYTLGHPSQYDLDHVITRISQQTDQQTAMLPGQGARAMMVGTQNSLDRGTGGRYPLSRQCSMDSRSAPFSFSTQNSLDMSSVNQQGLSTQNSMDPGSVFHAPSSPFFLRHSTPGSMQADQGPALYPPGACQVIASNIPEDYTAEQLRPFFQLAGNVLDLTMLRHEATRSFVAIVMYATRGHAESAIQRFHMQHALPGPAGMHMPPMEIRLVQPRQLPPMEPSAAGKPPALQLPQWPTAQDQQLYPSPSTASSGRLASPTSPIGSCSPAAQAFNVQGPGLQVSPQVENLLWMRDAFGSPDIPDGPLGRVHDPVVGAPPTNRRTDHSGLEWTSGIAAPSPGNVAGSEAGPDGAQTGQFSFGGLSGPVTRQQLDVLIDGMRSVQSVPENAMMWRDGRTAY